MRLHGFDDGCEAAQIVQSSVSCSARSRVLSAAEVDSMEYSVEVSKRLHAAARLEAVQHPVFLSALGSDTKCGSQKVKVQEYVL
jgi:hypothetical protein